MITLLRIDSRLIHGQIVEGWLRAFPVDEIIIIDDEIYINPFETKILKFSVLAGVSFEVLTTEKAAERWQMLKNLSKKIIVLMQSIENLVKLYETAVELPAVNLGLVNYTDSKTALTKSIYISGEEKRQLEILLSKGVDIYVQTLPVDEKIPLGKILSQMEDK